MKQIYWDNNLSNIQVEHRAALFFRRWWVCERARGLFGCPFCCLLSCVAGTWWKVCGELPAAEVIIVWVSSKMWPWSYFPWSRHSKQTHNHDSTLCGLDWSCYYSFKKCIWIYFDNHRCGFKPNPLCNTELWTQPCLLEMVFSILQICNSKHILRKCQAVFRHNSSMAL